MPSAAFDDLTAAMIPALPDSHHCDASSSSKCSFESLPNEIVRAIFKNLSSQWDLHCLASTCKRMNALATPLLYEAPDFCSYESLLLFLTTVETHAELGRAVRKLSIAFHRHEDSSTLPLLAKLLNNCPELDDLDLRDCLQQVRDEEATCIATYAQQLRSLSLSMLQYITDEGLQQILTHCKNLRHLEIACMPEITDKSFRFLAENPNLLEKLNIAYGSIEDETLALLIRNAKRLRYLDITGCLCVETKEYLEVAPAHLTIVTHSSRYSDWDQTSRDGEWSDGDDHFDMYDDYDEEWQNGYAGEASDAEWEDDGGIDI
ncbi:hypothetical protein HKX48_000040 [Thoreauomyces humboldtii]|nr:hypothetical protein HKX48_000040 [Thoreauomyces humboldtii]